MAKGLFIVVCVGALCVADDPAVTPAACWTDFLDRITECGNLPDHEARLTCNNGARTVLSACLAQVPAPDPANPPATSDCWAQFLKDMKACLARFPAGDRPGTPASDRRSGCLAGALAKFNWCFARVPRDKPIISITSAGKLAPNQAQLSVVINVQSGTLPHARFYLQFEDSLSPTEYTLVLVGEAVGISAGDTTLVLDIPATVYARCQTEANLIVEGIDIFDENFGGAAEAVYIEWKPTDKNFDTHVNIVDLSIALNQFFAGELDQEGVQAVIHDME